MSEYQHYVTYRNDTEQVRDRVERAQRTRLPGRSRPGRQALARRLHSIADRLES
mgnify:FL=1